MNSNTFNIKRFGSYMASDIKNCIANFGLSGSLIAGTSIYLYLLYIIFNLLTSGEWNGLGLGLRAFAFCIALAVLVTSLPVKCFGNITDKKAGSSWLMLPASRTEKFLSMVILSTIIMPLVIIAGYMFTDWLICLIDPRCGDSLISAGRGLLVAMIEAETTGDLALYPALERFTDQVSNPLLYVDDAIGMMLIFLLGAIFFKKRKTSKTILAWIVLTTVAGMIMVPFTKLIFGEIASNAAMAESADNLNILFDTWVFRNVALLDTINDTITNLVLLTCIYFRIKTLKH